MARMRRYWRCAYAGLAVALILARVATAAPPPPPGPPPPPPPRENPPPPPPPNYYPPPPPYYPPPVIIEPAPPPLSPVMRGIYAPFYAAGLVLRYGFYYLIVAPFEVFGRALTYGVEGGVEKDDAQH